MKKLWVERNALIFLLALVIGILIYVLYSQRQRRFIMKKLRSQNIEIKQQKEEISAQTEHLTEINEKLEYLSIVASKTDSAIAIFDEVGNLEWVNEGVTRLYGYDLHQLKRERGTNIIKISSYPNISELFRQAQTEKRTIIYESVFTARDGGKIYSHTTLTPVLDIEGHIIRFVAIDSDISKLKKVEEKLQSQHDELQKLNATKDRLFSIIAHDLKNPFYSLIGFTDILLAQYKELSDEQKIEILNIINSSSKEAHYLLENLLIWSRSQTHKIFINKASHNLSHLIQQNIDLLKGSAEKKQIKISANLDSTINIFVDKDMINTVLRNLISNGIKFTFEGGQIIIETKRIESRVEISVKDTGIGIKEEKIDKLFKLDQFQTTTGTSNETGTGLGLIISKEFTEANGGQIFATSEPGIGSTFYVILLCI
jgi:PAS domain S-box-containing protein